MNRLTFEERVRRAKRADWTHNNRQKKAKTQERRIRQKLRRLKRTHLQPWERRHRK